MNVNITRLEGEAIMRTLRLSPRIAPEGRLRIIAESHRIVSHYGLDRTADTFASTYSCPLYAPGLGCLVHYKAKPAPCTQHGCYENWEDLPDAVELAHAESKIADLNRAVYGADEAFWGFKTIPHWISILASESVEEPSAADEPEPDLLVRIRRRRGGVPLGST